MNTLLKVSRINVELFAVKFIRKFESAITSRALSEKRDQT